MELNDRICIFGSKAHFPLRRASLMTFAVNCKISTTGFQGKGEIKDLSSGRVRYNSEPFPYQMQTIAYLHSYCLSLA